MSEYDFTADELFISLIFKIILNFEALQLVKDFIFCIFGKFHQILLFIFMIFKDLRLDFNSFIKLDIIFVKKLKNYFVITKVFIQLSDLIFKAA
jgi:hypothetical protein